MTKKVEKVAVAGGFDPFHEGHLQHIEEAAKLGKFLIVFVNNDADMIRKKGKCNLPMWFRIRTVELWLRDLNIVGVVVPTIDSDGTQAKTLELHRPDVFAKGGDRTPDNLPRNEIAACKKIGCKIVYGVGKQLNQSSKMKMG